MSTFIVIRQDGKGVNLLNFDVWEINQVQKNNTYAIFAQRYTSYLSDENIMKYVFENLGEFDTKAKAEKGLNAINNSLLARAKSYLQSSGAQRVVDCV